MKERQELDTQKKHSRTFFLKTLTGKSITFEVELSDEEAFNTPIRPLIEECLIEKGIMLETDKGEGRFVCNGIEIEDTTTYMQIRKFTGETLNIVMHWPDCSETAQNVEFNEPSQTNSARDIPQQKKPHADSERNALIDDLNKYINRIKRHETPNKKPDFFHGFWFFCFRTSRAINREANYLLAQSLLDKLENSDSTISAIFHDIEQQREEIISEHKLDKREGYVERGVEGSVELNTIINKVKQRIEISAPTNFEHIKIKV